MATRVLITVDTELTWRHHVAGADWRDNYSRSVEPGGVGLSYQLEKLREFGLKACFFIDPMPAAIFGLDPVKRMVETVLEGGQGVQLHCHPMWLDAAKHDSDPEKMRFELTEFGYDEQREIIAQAREWLIEAGAPMPVAFRSGSYAANTDTLRALRDLGFTYDTSHNGCEAPWPSAIDLPEHQITPAEEKGIVEIPVTQLRVPGGGLRHTQICAISRSEMRSGIDHAIKERLPVFTIVGHSFELATRDGQRPNRLIKARFDRLCAMLARRADKAQTTHFADLDRVPLDIPAHPVPISFFTVANRMAEQLTANMLEKVAL